MVNTELLQISQYLMVNNLPTNFIGLYKDGCSSDYCDRMIKRFDEIEKEKAPFKGELNGGVRFRKDFAIWLEEEDSSVINETNEILNINLQKYVDEYPSLGMQHFKNGAIKIQRTPPKGGFHTWHTEHEAGGDSSFRTLTWSIYLNDTPQGEGQTEFIEYGEKVQPKKGLVSFFPASFTHTHRGNPVYSCQKYISTGWFSLISQSFKLVGHPSKLM